MYDETKRHFGSTNFDLCHIEKSQTQLTTLVKLTKAEYKF